MCIPMQRNQIRANCVQARSFSHSLEKRHWCTLCFYSINISYGYLFVHLPLHVWMYTRRTTAFLPFFNSLFLISYFAVQLVFRKMSAWKVGQNEERHGMIWKWNKNTIIPFLVSSISWGVRMHTNIFKFVPILQCVCNCLTIIQFHVDTAPNVSAIERFGIEIDALCFAFISNEIIISTIIHDDVNR